MRKAVFVSIVTCVGLLMSQVCAEEIKIHNPDGTSVAFDVDVARTHLERKRGLQYVSELPDHKGMIFLYNNPKPVSMWMKKTALSLDMVFFDETHRVHHLEPDTQPFSADVIGPIESTYSVLEIPAGSCERFGIRIGSVLENRPS